MTPRECRKQRREAERLLPSPSFHLRSLIITQPELDLRHGSCADPRRFGHNHGKIHIPLLGGATYDGSKAMDIRCYELHGVRVAELPKNGDQLEIDRQAIEIISEASACHPVLIIIPVDRFSDDCFSPQDPDCRRRPSEICDL